ncbi:hypothetical protein PAXRUDRAFT_131036 [Paxillus rubicundulus Ve08.2h10]|uniref:DNA helicase n=1 Tax=Paxillus rubicundulus Ve08.2h10 TaxID=930991 RepID=A0A0D0E5J7_9AGAM|nr:hypothetical protein PAXRUDRAFT_131036 [Paxillus rubicundulus Ve08.2h10]
MWPFLQFTPAFTQNTLQGVLVNGSLGKVIEFITTHDAQKRHIEIAEMERRKEGQAPVTVNSPDSEENQPGLTALDHCTFQKAQLWPLVKFTNNKCLLCSPVEFTLQGLKGNLEVRRLQVPISLSWAMSIHKSQGQTLTRVKVDLARIFEKGQGDLLIFEIGLTLTCGWFSIRCSIASYHHGGT